MKIKLRHLFFGVMLAFASASAQDYEHLTVTGYNADVIANGVGSALSSISAPVDNANYAFMSNDFLPSTLTTPPVNGLPAAGLINSLATTGLSYQMASLSGNNALRFGATSGPTTGTISFTNAVNATKLYVLATSGSGSSTVTALITFNDATTQTVTGVIVPDWFNSTTQPIAAWGFGRVNTTNNGVETSTNNPRLYQIALNIDIANQSKTVSSIQFTKTTTTEGVVSVFAVTAEEVPSCPVIASTTSATASPTSGTISWTLGTAGQGTGATTYTLEVYTDAGYTTPITGSPFTGLTASSYTLTGLTFETQYYYRVKANNGTCDSAYLTGIFSPAYCLPTKSGTSTSYYVSNVSTTGGYTNISNATATSATAGYTNYAATQIVSKPAGTSFNYSITRGSTSTTVGVWVDWNNDLDFDDVGETIGNYVGGFSGQTTNIAGTITIPTGTPVGNYRMRVRSTYYFNITVVPCGALLYGETEDYNIAVVTPPADCATPDAPTLALTNVTATGLDGTVTMPTTAPSGYILVRSTTPTLSAEPATGSSYAVGATIGGGRVISAGTTISTFAEFLNNNTHYYYFIYAYNENGSACFGPKYSVAGTANATTCAGATTAVGAFDVTAASANLAWTSVVGTGGAPATYTVQVYTDLALTTLFGTYTSATPGYALTGLTNGSTYYFRVKAETTSCDNDAWSSAVSFIAANNYTPLSLTGFNSDVIANGNGVANLSTTNAVDAVDNAYMSLDYKANATSTAATFGLPVNRRLTGSLSGLTLLLQDYSANNSLRIPAQNQAGTLTLTTPVKASKLYFGVTSGSGTATVSAQVLFSDGTSQTETGLSVLNWDNAVTAPSPAIASAIGRVNRANTVGAPDGPGAFKVFQLTVNIAAENQSKLITGVTFTKTSTGATEPVPHVFAISAKTIDDCPVLNDATAVAISNGAVITTTLISTSGVPTSYTVEVYTDAAFTTPVTGSPFTGITTAAYTATGLAPLTTYYFRVKALNNTCVSDYVTGTFTTLDGCTTPAVPTAAAQTLCSGATVANLTATAITGAAIKWYAAETGGDALAATTVLASGTYYASQQIDVCESARVAVMVTINTTAAPVAASQTFCAGATVAELQATTLTGATVVWSATQGGTALTGTEVLVSGTYYVSQTLNACPSTAIAVVVTVNTTAAPTASAQTFCAGATVADLVATYATGATNAWSLTSGGAALATTTPLVSGNYYVTQTLNSCQSAATTVAVTVNTTAAPTASAQTFCAGATVAELQATTLTGATVVWSATQGGTALTGTEVLVSGTYYVSQTLNACPSTATAVIVTINTTAAPVAAAQTFCNGATVANLVATTLTGATVVWSATEDGTALESTAVLTSGTYYVSQTLNACPSTAAAVVVTVNTTAAPTAVAQTFCAGATVAELQATTLTGATVTWSATQGGVALEATAVLASGTYYVSQTLNACPSTAAAVVVTVNTTPAPIVDDFTFCAGATAADLNLDEASVTWYATQGGTALADDFVLTTGTYYVTQTLNACESPATAVQITINALPAAPSGSETQTFTTGETIADLEVTTAEGATVTWYTLNDAGEYTAVPTTTVLEDGVTYYVSQTTNACESAYFDITADVVAGTHTFTKANLKVYPNPANDYVTVTNTTAISKVTVTNLLGQTVITQNANANTVQVNLSSLAAGTYILQVNADGSSANVKIVKQ